MDLVIVCKLLSLFLLGNLCNGRKAGAITIPAILYIYAITICDTGNSYSIRVIN